MCRLFASHIMISAYFAICCDVHSTPRPENPSSDRRLIHYTRAQLLSFNNGASNINDIGFHGLLRLHNSLLLNGYLSPAYGNVNDVGTNQISDLMDILKRLTVIYKDFTTACNNSTLPSKSPIMNTNDSGSRFGKWLYSCEDNYPH